MKTKLFELEETEIIDVQNDNLITVAQLRCRSNELENIISIHKAFEDNLIIISENSEMEEVGQIELENLSNSYVFILDGDILKGAKQNRVINTSVLVAPKSKIILPVSCVEKGRWSYRSRNFSPSDEVAHRSIRYSKTNFINSNKKANISSFEANQSDVWKQVANVNYCVEFVSDTESHSDLFDEYKDELKDLTKEFKCSDMANGIAIFIGDHLYSCEIFNNNNLLKDYFMKLLKTSAMDVKLGSHDQICKLDNQKLIYDTINNIVGEFNKSTDLPTHNPGVDAGIETRLNLNDITFYSLCHQKEIVHQSIFVKSKLNDR